MDTFGHIIRQGYVVTPDTIYTSADWSRKKIIATDDGGFAIIGGAIGLDTNDIYLMKVNEHLELDFIKYFFVEQFMSNGSLINIESGYLIAVDIEQESSPISTDLLMIKTDYDGNEVWRSQLGSFNHRETPTDLIVLNQNEFLVVGNRSDYPSTNDLHWPQSTWSASYATVIDNNGNELWSWMSDTASSIAAVIYKALPMSDGGWMCTSLTWERNPAGGFAGRPALVRYNENFDVMWEKSFGLLGATRSVFRDLERTHDGNFIASGFLTYDVNKRPQGTHYKFTPEGDSLWMRLDSIYPLTHTRVQATEILSSGSIMSIGYVSIGPYGETGFVMKLNPNGCLDTLNCFPFSSTDNTLYEGDELNIYPNPAYDYVTIDIPEKLSGDIQLIVRDRQGRIVI